MKNLLLIFTLSLFIAHAQNQDKDFYKEEKRISLYPEGIPCKSDFETVVDYNSTGRTFKKIADPEIWYFPSRIKNDISYLKKNSYKPLPTLFFLPKNYLNFP